MRSRSPKYKCSNCDNAYTYPESMRRHELRCKGLTVQLKCEICQQSVDSLLMSAHIRTKHKQIQQQCPECKKSFTTNWYLKKHLAAVHRGEGKLPCDICGKMCSSKIAVDLHKRAIHTNEYAVFCDVCGKGFVAMHSLKRHLKTTHRTDDEPVETFPCPITGCSKSYRSKASLKLHLPTHNDQKPLHPCPHCDKVLHHPISLKVNFIKLSLVAFYKVVLRCILDLVTWTPRKCTSAMCAIKSCDPPLVWRTTCASTRGKNHFYVNIVRKRLWPENYCDVTWWFIPRNDRIYVQYVRKGLLSTARLKYILLGLILMNDGKEWKKLQMCLHSFYFIL